MTAPADGPLDVLVIGGGQAGLAIGYQLAQRGQRFLIVDASAQIGQAWRSRWDSLVLFTPAQYDNLPRYAWAWALRIFAPSRGDDAPRVPTLIPNDPACLRPSPAA